MIVTIIIIIFYSIHTVQGKIQYGVIGDFPAPYFFYVDPTSGEVFVKSGLKSDKAFSYTVSLIIYYAYLPNI